MRARWSLVAAIGVAVAASGCSLGAKQDLADRVTDAGARLERAGAASAEIGAQVVIVKSDKPLAPGPPKILPAQVTEVPAVLDLARGNAALGVRDGDPRTAVLVFRGTDMYQRIAPKSSKLAAAVLSSAASNLDPLVAAYHGITLVSPAEAPSTTSTTIAHGALQRASRIPREWIAFHYADLDKKDSTKRAGSLAINPTVVLGLVRGVLTGSISQHGDRYDVNVNRDKAERHLSEGERKEIDKIFRANAISGRTFKAHIWLDATGELRRLEVRMRQRLTSVDRADLTVRIDIIERGIAATIGAPDRRATATVGSLGQLVTSVSRA